MADKEMFSYWVTQPELLQKSDIEKLTQLTEQYPYFQLAHMLLAKAVSVGEPGALARHLPEASIYSYNRRALQMLVENDMEWSADLLSRLTRAKMDAFPKMENTRVAPEEPKIPSETGKADDFQFPYDPTVLAEFTMEHQLGTAPAESPRTPVQELIEKFIKSDPSIRKLPTDSSTQEEVEDLSLRNQIALDDLATESFAEILAKQGKKDKAIGIYEKLILKMPEKKDYFAKKIQMLK